MSMSMPINIIRMPSIMGFLTSLYHDTCSEQHFAVRGREISRAFEQGIPFNFFNAGAIPLSINV
jgi:hypothetical protein